MVGSAVPGNNVPFMKDKNYLANLFSPYVIKGTDRGPLRQSPIDLSALLREMTILAKNRASFGRFAVAFLGLAVCVFAWGLQYKLSLYDPPQASSHQVPQAKLLSKDQWSPSPGGLRASMVTSPSGIWAEQLYTMLFAFLLALGAESALSHRQKHRDGSKPWLAWSSASLSAFFFRPPPSAIA
jgi:hypothetical protein